MSIYTLLSPTNVIGTLPPAPVIRPIPVGERQSLQVINGNPLDANLPVTPPAQQAFQLTVTGTGAISGTVQIYGSNDAVHWLTIGSTITANGNTSVSTGANGTVPFAFFGCLLTAISGTNARATVTMSC